MIENAIRNHFRFQSKQGLLTTEDLYDLELTQLNTIAIAVKKQLAEESEESFIETKSKKNVELESKLEILIHIINTKKAEKEAAKSKAAKKAQIDQLNRLLNNKKLSEMENLSSEELEKRIAELQEDGGDNIMA